MKINRLATTASQGGALSQRLSAVSKIVRKSLGTSAGMTHVLLACLAVISTGLVSPAQAATIPAVTLAWNANPETNITGYRLSYGTASGVYPNVVNVGTTPTTSISGLSDGTSYYFVVSAINQSGLQSSNSSEITYRVEPPVTTNQAPVALAASKTTAEDTAVSITLAGTDAESSPLTFSVVASPTKGTLSGTAPNLSYLPSADYNGSDSFTFRVNDGTQNSATATISITVTPVNDAPVATSKSVTTAEDTPLAIVLAGTDKDLNTLTYSVVASPTNGTLTGTAPNLTYTPAANFNGSDQFTFRVNDGSVNSTTATVSITVTSANDAPVALAKSLTTSEDTPLSLILTGTDTENSTLTFSIVSGPANGTLGGTAPNLIYSPAADFNGSDSFTFRVNDGTVNSATATISISVTPVNDAPVATAKTVTTAEDTAVSILLSGSDKDLNSLTFSVLTNPTNGTLSGTAPNLTYTPTTNYNGSDQFTFRVNDGTVNSPTATVSITVTTTNDAPVALAKSLTTAEDTLLPITLGGTDTEGNSLTYTLLTSPTKGTISGTAPNLSYTPSLNYNGSDSFTYVVNDGIVNSQPATVSITVTPVNDAPAANSITLTTPANSPRSFVLGGSDPDGNPLTFSIISSPTKGTLTGTAPNLTYQPNTGYSGSDQFTFKTSDGTLTSALATVSISVSPVSNIVPNLPPVFSADPFSFQATQDQPVSGQLLATDANAGDILTFTKISGPAWLTVSAGGALGGSPGNANVGANSFVVRVADQLGAFDDSTLLITVANVNGGPVFLTNPVLVAEASENAAYAGQSLAGKAVDPDAGDSLTYWKVSGPAWLNIASNGDLSGTPPKGSAGLNSFIIRAADSTASADAQLQISVSGLPLPWTSADLGTGQPAGSVSWKSGIFTQTGSGALGGSGDKLRFTYQTLSGDGDITAKINLVQNVGPASQVGIMIRESLAPKARQVFIGLTNDKSYRLVSRTKYGKTNSITGYGAATSPDAWVRLIRIAKSNQIYAFKSADGVNWSYIGASNAKFPTFCYVGLAVSSGSDSAVNVSEFSNVSVTP